MSFRNRIVHIIIIVILAISGLAGNYNSAVNGHFHIINGVLVYHSHIVGNKSNDNIPVKHTHKSSDVLNLSAANAVHYIVTAIQSFAVFIHFVSINHININKSIIVILNINNSNLLRAPPLV